MKKTIIAGIAGAAIAGGALGFAAPALADTPCSYLNTQDPVDSNEAIARSGICGVPDIVDSIANAGANLSNNFSPSNAAKNVQDNFNAGDAAANLQHSLTKGVGSGDAAASAP
jgi:hypothetical protein